MTKRIRVSAKGSIKLPEKVMEKLGWASGSYLEFKTSGDRVEIWRVDVDPFAEAVKKPDDDAFDRVLKRQKEDQSRAVEHFEETMKDPPEARPEDRPEFWD